MSKISDVKTHDVMCFLGKVDKRLQKHFNNANRRERKGHFKTLFNVCLGDGQVDFNEFMTILGPKLLSSETREGFLGSTIDTIFWQVKLFIFFL